MRVTESRNRLVRPGPLREPVLAFVVVLAAACLSCLAVYLRSAGALKDEVREHILQLSCAASAVVDGDLHTTFTSPEQEGDPEYERAIRPLAAFLAKTPHLLYVYTFVQRDGKLYMVLDPSPVGDNDHDGVEDKAHIMEPYPAATEPMFRVLEDGRPAAESEPTGDQWGTFMSAYAPVFDSTGAQVGAVGVDVGMDCYRERLAGVRQALTLGLAIALALSSLVGLAVRALRLTSMRAQKAVADMIEELKAARDSADSAARANAEFLANMSHEIRNPMNAILGLSDLLLDAESPPEMRPDLELIHRSGVTLLAILNDVLDISKLEAGKFTLRQEAVDLRALASDTVRLFSPLAAAHATALTLQVDPCLPPRILADPTRLAQILSNLLSNALKFTDGGKVSLEVDRDPDRPGWIRFRVADTGVGIPEDEVDRVFDKFVQSGSAGGTGRRGTGLGLTIARSLVELMGGSIRASSRVGEGSTFMFEIPGETPESTAADADPGGASLAA